jgi:hypothetical protein
MQNVNFRSVEEFLDYLPADELKIVEALREIVFECIPDCTEKLSYNVPFYKRSSNICFIWPASITWGGVKQHGVRFGFTKGYLIRDESHYLDKGDRKQVYWKDFFALKEIDADLLRSYLLEAVELDALVKPKSASRQNAKK